MKRITVILLCILLCISIVGCTANTGSPISSTPTASTVSVTETIDNEKQTEAEVGSSETTDVGVESVSDTAATSSTDKEVPPATDRPTSFPESEKADTSKKPDTSAEEKKPETSAPTESEKKPNETRPQETKPEETKPQETTPPKDETKHPEESKSTEPEQPADPYAYPFDINQIRRDCIAQGKSYGFTLDESLTPNNSSWSGAETASANTQGTRLKSFLSELVEYYSPAYRESMGLSEVNITAFNIYVEDLGNNTYRIYFLFLL